MAVREASTGAGRESLPARQRDLMRRAIRLEWITLAFKVVTIPLVGIVAGQSQAMKTAWYEDILELLPPVAFLVAARTIRREPGPKHPYGRHRDINVSHLVASGALLAMGVYLLIESTLSLVHGERPPIGAVELFGHSVWLGWLMIVVMIISAIGPVILGRLKLKLVEELHDKVLYADADMNKADWMTAVATVVGILGVGMGWWWMDAATAVVVSFSIIRDGWTNLRTSVRDLTDARPTDMEGNVHPMLDKAVNAAREEPWVASALGRFRDMGHVLHVELFVVPRAGHELSVGELTGLRQKLEQLDYQLHDVVVVPVAEIPDCITDAKR